MGLSKEGFRCFEISFLTQPYIHQIAIFINASIQIEPLALHSDIGFIDKPNLANFSLAFRSQLLSNTFAKAFFPIAYCFMRELNSQSEEFAIS